MVTVAVVKACESDEQVGDGGQPAASHTGVTGVSVQSVLRARIRSTWKCLITGVHESGHIQ